jgi:hypothetical protein
MSDKYILDGHTPVPCDDFLRWARFFADVAGRRVALTVTPTGVEVSTLFLGVQHHGRLVLFETMILGGPLDGYQQRYSTWEEAEAGHAAAVQRAEG